MSNLFKQSLDLIAKKFGKDPSKMLIATGVIGWGLSSAAQMLGIVFNPEISDKQKGYLLPQEFSDAVVNIGLFFCMTLTAKWLVSSLFKTGKIAPQSVREFIKKQNLSEKVGKLDLNLDDYINQMPNLVKRDYNAYKNIAASVATVGSGIVASNVLTPIIRNNNASNMQKKYLDYKNNNPVNYSSDMKI